MSQGKNDNKVFQRATGEYGSKSRKQDGPKRRTAMKTATREELVAELFKTEQPIKVMEPGDRLTHLENEVKHLKQEVKRWKAKSDAMYKQWWKDLWRHGNKPPEIDLVLEKINSEWEIIKNAGFDK